MLARRDELCDELVVLLGASRELSPETDRYLAEMFLDQLDRRRALTSPQGSSRRWFRDPRRAGAALLLAGLAIGAPLTLHASQGGDRDLSPVPSACSAFVSWPGAYAPWHGFNRDEWGARHEHWFSRPHDCE